MGLLALAGWLLTLISLSSARREARFWRKAFDDQHDLHMWHLEQERGLIRDLAARGLRVRFWRKAFDDQHDLHMRHLEQERGLIRDLAALGLRVVTGGKK
jgi:hypothetical protein